MLLEFKKEIKISTDINIKIRQNKVVFKSLYGEAFLDLPEGFHLRKNTEINYLLIFSSTNTHKYLKKVQTQNFSLIYKLLLQKIKGVTYGFSRTLFFIGVGYNVQIENQTYLNLKLGYSDKIILEIPKNLKVFCPKRNILIIEGVSLQEVTQFAAKIRFYRLPNIYKHKGVLYKGETIKLKESKKNK